MTILNLTRSFIKSIPLCGAWGYPPLIFFEKPRTKVHQSQCSPPPPPSPPSLKRKAPFQENIPTKKPKKLETVINTCVSLIKQRWRKIVEIPQKCCFLNWSIQNFVRKVKEFLKKYYVFRLIRLVNRFYGVEKFLDFIFCHVLLSIFLFYWEVL